MMIIVKGVVKLHFVVVVVVVVVIVIVIVIVIVLHFSCWAMLGYVYSNTIHQSQYITAS